MIASISRLAIGLVCFAGVALASSNAHENVIQSFTTYLNPQKGLDILNALSPRDYYDVFCRFSYEEADTITSESLRDCERALHQMQKRLLALAEGHIDKPVDMHFLNALNKAILNGGDKRRQRVKQLARHGVFVTHRDSAEEIHKIVNNIHRVSGIDVFGHRYCESPEDVDDLLYMLDGIDMEDGTSLKAQYDYALICHKEQIKAQEGLNGTYGSIMADRQVLDIKSWQKMEPYPVRLMSHEELTDMGVLIMYGLAGPAVTSYGDNFLNLINQTLAGSSWTARAVLLSPCCRPVFLIAGAFSQTVLICVRGYETFWCAVEMLKGNWNTCSM